MTNSRARIVDQDKEKDPRAILKLRITTFRNIRWIGENRTLLYKVGRRFRKAAGDSCKYILLCSTEHEVIRRMMEVIDILRQPVPGFGQDIEVYLEGIIDFLCMYVDRCHHAKVTLEKYHATLHELEALTGTASLPTIRLFH